MQGPPYKLRPIVRTTVGLTDSRQTDHRLSSFAKALEKLTVATAVSSSHVISLVSSSFPSSTSLGFLGQSLLPLVKMLLH